MKDLVELPASILLCIIFASAMMGAGVTFAYSQDKYSIIKTNIGEFILRNGKVYGVYELARDARGDLVVR